MNTVFDVAVIGAGSTGATIAAMLAERQIKVILLEKALPASTGASAWSGVSFVSMSRIWLCWRWPGLSPGAL